MNKTHDQNFQNYLLEPEFLQLKQSVRGNPVGAQCSLVCEGHLLRFQNCNFPIQFGKYVLKRLIGQGGMGIVYFAEHITTEKKVAIKVIGGETGSAQLHLELSKRFEAEWKAIAEIRHPNVVEIFDTGVVDGVPFYAMEYLSGQSLAKVLQSGPLSAMKATSLIQSVAMGLSVVHNKGFVHRDIKPNNIVLNEKGPKILDFGLARNFKQTCTRNTKTGAVMGTICFMSPEQIEDAKNATIRSDVFSLGAVLYNSITGVPPFSGSDSVETIFSVMNSDPIDASVLNPEVPMELNAICLKCLEKNPLDRYENVQSLLDDLDRFQNGVPVSAKKPGSLKKIYSFLKRNKKFGFVFLASASSVVLCTLFLLSFYIYMHDSNILLLIKSADVLELRNSNNLRFFSRERLIREFREESDESKKNKLALVLGDQSDEVRSFITSYILDCPLEELSFLLKCTQRATWNERKDFFWKVATNRSEDVNRRMRAMAVLASIDPNSKNWKDVQAFLADSLLSCNVIEATEWVDLYDRVLLNCQSRFVLEPYDDQNDLGVTIPLIVLAKLMQYDSSILIRLVPNASPVQFQFLSTYSSKIRSKITRSLERKISDLKKRGVFERTDKDRSQLANCYLGLISFSRKGPAAIFADIHDPTVEILVASRCKEYQINIEKLIQSLESVKLNQITQKRLLLIACAYYSNSHISRELKERLRKCVITSCLSSDDAGVHYTAKWMLKKWKLVEDSKFLDSSSDKLLSANRNWFTTKSGYEMVIVKKPYNLFFPLKPAGTPRYQNLVDELQQPFSQFCIGCNEVTWGQYSTFARTHGIEIPNGIAFDLPVTNRNFGEMARYCNWLTVQDDLGESEQCFKELNGRMVLVDDYKKRKGYRFATFFEHYNSIAESGFLQNNNQLYRMTGWIQENSNGRMKSVGQLQPNAFGLFDICGNAKEWSCGYSNGKNPWGKAAPYGGSGSSAADYSDRTNPYQYRSRGDDAHEYYGIRLVRGVSKKLLKIEEKDCFREIQK